MTTQSTLRFDIVWPCGKSVLRQQLILDKEHPASNYHNGVLRYEDDDRPLAGEEFVGTEAYIIADDRRIACNALGLPIDTPHVQAWFDEERGELNRLLSAIV